MPSSTAGPITIDPAEREAIEFYLLTEAAYAAEQLADDPHADDVEDRFADLAWFGGLVASMRAARWPADDRRAAELLERALLEDAGHIATETWISTEDRRLDMDRYKALRRLRERANPEADRARA